MLAVDFFPPLVAFDADSDLDATLALLALLGPIAAPPLRLRFPAQWSELITCRTKLICSSSLNAANPVSKTSSYVNILGESEFVNE